MLYTETESGFLREMSGESDDYNKYRSAKEKNTISSYQSYLSEYPNGMFVEEASLQLGELKKALAIANDNDAFKKAKQADTIESYKAYLSAFVNGLHAKEANDAIWYIGEEDGFWRQSSKANSIDTYNDYIKKYPKGRYVSLATSNIEKLRKIEQDKIKDNNAYSEAERIHTVYSYQNYLLSYPNGLNAAKANKKLAGLLEEQRQADRRRQEYEQKLAKQAQLVEQFIDKAEKDTDTDDLLIQLALAFAVVNFYVLCIIYKHTSFGFLISVPLSFTLFMCYILFFIF